MAWNGSDTTKASQSNDQLKKQGIEKSFNLSHGLWAGLFVVVCVSIAWWLVAGRDKPPKSPVRNQVRTAKLHDVVPIRHTNAIRSDDGASTNSAKWKAANGLDPSLFPYKDGRKVIASRTNEFNQIIDICIMPNGRSRKVVRDGRKPVFKHSTDVYIASVLSGGNDAELPPIPIADGMEATFLESLKTPIVINDEDSDEVRNVKQGVIEARKFIDEELRTGRSLKNILEDHMALRKKNAETKAEAEGLVREMLKTSDAETGQQYVKKVNEWLKQQGISEISIPDQHMRQLMKKGKSNTQQRK